MLSGQVEVVIHGLLVKTLSSGVFVGEGVLVGNGKRAASIRAATACEVLVLSRDAFEKVLLNNPRLRRQVRCACWRRTARMPISACAHARVLRTSACVRADGARCASRRSVCRRCKG